MRKTGCVSETMIAHTHRNPDSHVHIHTWRPTQIEGLSQTNHHRQTQMSHPQNHYTLRQYDETRWQPHHCPQCPSSLGPAAPPPCVGLNLKYAHAHVSRHAHTHTGRETHEFIHKDMEYRLGALLELLQFCHRRIHETIFQRPQGSM